MIYTQFINSVYYIFARKFYFRYFFVYRIYLYTVHRVVLCNYFHLHRHLHRIVRAGLTLSEGTRHIRARDKRFYFFSSSFSLSEQGKARREKREWRHFFLARSLSKTKRNSRALVRSFVRSFVRFDGYFPLLRLDQ